MKPADSTRAKGSAGAPKLVAVPEAEGPGRAAPGPGRRPEPSRGDGVSKGLLRALVGLLALSLLGLLVQTQRVASRNDQIARLSERVGGLEAQLSAADAQLASYQRQLAAVRSSVSDLLERMTGLAELVETDPVGGGSPPTAPEAP